MWILLLNIFLPKVHQFIDECCRYMTKNYSETKKIPVLTLCWKKKLSFLKSKAKLTFALLSFLYLYGYAKDIYTPFFSSSWIITKETASLYYSVIIRPRSQQQLKSVAVRQEC